MLRHRGKDRITKLFISDARLFSTLFTLEICIKLEALDNREVYINTQLIRFWIT